MVDLGQKKVNSRSPFFILSPTDNHGSPNQYNSYAFCVLRRI
jgi:hypothetical protein